MLSFSTCVLVSIVLATPARTTYHYAIVPYGELANRDLSITLSELIGHRPVKVQEGHLSLRRPDEDCGDLPRSLLTGVY